MPLNNLKELKQKIRARGWLIQNDNKIICSTCKGDI